MNNARATNDYAFKQIFGDKKETDVLKSFINAALKLEGNAKVESIEVFSSEQVPVHKDNKTTFVDVFARDKNANEFIVEMQMLAQKSFVERAEYYLAKQFSNQLNSGEYYSKLKKVYLIAILGFELENTEHYRTRQIMIDPDRRVRIANHMELCFLELPKFTKEEISHSDNMLDKWMYFLKYVGEKYIDLDILQEEEFKKATQVLHKIGLDKDEWHRYDKAQEVRRAYATDIADNLEKGRDEGRAEGREEGREEERAAMIKKMLASKMTIKEIQKITGIPKEEIEKILI